MVAGDTPVLVHNCNENIYRTPDEGVKHGTRTVDSARGANSAEPTNGQAALDNSVQIKPTSPRRVGYDSENDEIVILDQTGTEPCGCGDEEDGVNNIFHGHVRSDFESSLAMQGARNALRRAFKAGTIQR